MTVCRKFDGLAQWRTRPSVRFREPSSGPVSDFVFGELLGDGGDVAEMDGPPIRRVSVMDRVAVV